MRSPSHAHPARPVGGDRECRRRRRQHRGRTGRARGAGRLHLAIGSGDQFVINAAIYPVQYDVVKDFEPISLLMNGPNLIVSKNAVPATNLKELTAWLKANQANVSSAHNGAGGALHLCGIELQRVTGASWPFVPYRGAAPALQDVVGGRIDAMCTSPASSLTMVRGGLVRGYAITGNTRLASAPDIPTTDEAGFPGFQVSVWGGLWAPKGTPKDIIAKLNAAAVQALADPPSRRGSPTSGRSFFRAISRRRKRSARCRRPRSRNGGRSSRR